MAETTDAPPISVAETRPRGAFRFVVAFVVGLLAVLALGAGALYAVDRQYEGRILPGVHVAGLDLSGLTPAEARDRLMTAYGASSDGQLVLTGGERTTAVSYADLGRKVDIETLVRDAEGLGRNGSFLELVVHNARTALHGVDLQPRVVVDEAKLGDVVRAAAGRIDVAASDASVVATPNGFTVTQGREGRAADAESALAQASELLRRLDAPATVEVAIPVSTVEPRVTTAEATAARTAAERIARDIDVTVGDTKYPIKAATIRTWLRITPTVDGGYVPVVDIAATKPTLDKIAVKVRRDPKNATFLVGKGSTKVVGVVAGADGKRLDVAATTRSLVAALQGRGANQGSTAVPAAVKVTKPKLSTEEAEQAAPLMKRISTWTTYFPISEKNGFGANIWIPAKLIDGYVVAPGETFDFWKAVGPVSTARGFRRGGAIINGRTEPQGALAGGICSCSTTLFNAALRAGLDMGARRNHYYYIDRYPLGLDATVFISGSSVQTMSFTNDTKYPILIRGINTHQGGSGYVRFDLYSVPTGRKVSFSAPIVKNRRPASDSVVYTSSLPAGTSKRVEYPVEGKDVWVTRTVRDGSGQAIHVETFYSHYARITGIVQIGTGGGSAPAESATP